jgi:hypothetical protein
MSARPKRAAAAGAGAYKAQVYSDSESADEDSGSGSGSGSESEYKTPRDDSDDDGSEDESDDGDFKGLVAECEDEDDGDSMGDDEDADASDEESCSEDGDTLAMQIESLYDDAQANRDEATTQLALIVNKGKFASPASVYRSACALRTLARAGALDHLLQANAPDADSAPTCHRFLQHMMSYRKQLFDVVRECNNLLGQRGKRILALDALDTTVVWIHHLAKTMPAAKRASSDLKALQDLPEGLRQCVGEDEDLVFQACMKQFNSLLTIRPTKEMSFVLHNVLGAVHTTFAGWLDDGAITLDEVARLRATPRQSGNISSDTKVTRFGRKLRNDPPEGNTEVVKFSAKMDEGMVLVVEHIDRSTLRLRQHDIYDRLLASTLDGVAAVVKKVVDSGLNEIVPRRRNEFEFVTPEAAAEFKIKVSFSVRCAH